MAKLKCSNCGNTFEKKAMREYASLGLTNAGAGAGYGLVIWPFVLRVYAECPFCKKTEWIKVLPPWSKIQEKATQSQRP